MKLWRDADHEEASGRCHVGRLTRAEQGRRALVHTGRRGAEFTALDPPGAPSLLYLTCPVPLNSRQDLSKGLCSFQRGQQQSVESGAGRDHLPPGAVLLNSEPAQLYRGGPIGLIPGYVPDNPAAGV